MKHLGAKLKNGLGRVIARHDLRTRYRGARIYERDHTANKEYGEKDHIYTKSN